LGQRPAPEVPDSASELVDRLAGLHQEVNAELEAVLEGVSDEEASQSPAEGEWSVKQVLAHLTDGERGFHQVLSNIAVIGWHDAGGFYPDQFPGRLEAVLAVTPTLQGLIDRFLTDEAETVAILRGLPETTLAHKARYRRLGQVALGAPDHTREHVEQIKRAVEAVRR
ncbi:MAG: DinB family protein, partial [Anaerolineae bacterium]